MIAVKLTNILKSPNYHKVLKFAWADLKNQNKYSFIDRKKHKDGVTVTVNLACDKDIVAAAEYNESFSESDQSAYQEHQLLITQAKII